MKEKKNYDNFQARTAEKIWMEKNTHTMNGAVKKATFNTEKNLSRVPALLEE